MSYVTGVLVFAALIAILLFEPIWDAIGFVAALIGSVFHPERTVDPSQDWRE